MSKKPLLSAVQFIVHTLTKLEIMDRDNIPQEGGVLLTTNHLSRLDTPLLMSITDRDDLVAIIAKKYKKNLILRWILEKAGTMVWMDRERTDYSAVREALTLLREGYIVGIAPEGTRSNKSKALMEGKPGAAVMAARACVPILPVGIIGSENINDSFLKLRRPPITIRVGKPYTLPEINMDDRQAWLSHYTDEIMCQIAALLPPDYRGFYAEHPRVEELLVKNSMG